MKRILRGFRVTGDDSRTVIYFSEVERNLWMVEPMHFLRPDEARNEAKAIAAIKAKRRAL